MSKKQGGYFVILVITVIIMALFFLCGLKLSFSNGNDLQVNQQGEITRKPSVAAVPEETSVRKTEENPCLIVVCYKRQNKREFDEFVSIMPLNQALPVAILDEMKKKEQFPVVTTMTDNNGERLLSYNIICLEEGEKITRFRINIAVDTVVTRETFEYGGEEHLPVAHGDNWYMSVVRSLDSFK